MIYSFLLSAFWTVNAERNYKHCLPLYSDSGNEQPGKKEKTEKQK
jgi:hypothetical protein